MPESRFNTGQLAAHVTDAVSKLYQLAYAQISPDMVIIQTSKNFGIVVEMDKPVLGSRLPDVLAEFVGADDILNSVLRGEEPTYLVERVERDQPDGTVRYFTFQVLPFDSQQAGKGLLLIVEDMTRFGQIEHSLLQSRNELHLAQNALAQINAELDRRVEQRTTELENAKKQIEKQLHHLQTLRTNDLVILGATDLRFALKSIVEETRTQLRVDLASVSIFDPHTLTLETIAATGMQASWHGSRVRLGESILGRIALERRLMAFPNFNENKPDGLSAITGDEGIQAFYGIPLIAKGQIVGVLSIFNHMPLHPEQDWLDFLELLAGQTAMAIDSIKSFEDLQRSHLQLALAYSTTIEGWSHALDLRDHETQGHTQRVTDMTLRLARMAGISEAELVHVKHGALLHDIGKMGIPDTVLLKEQSLSDDEWATMRKHPIYAYEMLSPIEYLRPALDIPYCHHEKWDGTGYPRGLKGEQIPLVARLFAVVDVWDALRSDRPYRQGWPEDKVLEYIRIQTGTHFDPKVVALFASMMAGMQKTGAA